MESRSSCFLCMMLLLVFTVSCNGSGNPTIPGISDTPTGNSAALAGQTEGGGNVEAPQAFLWGYYDLFLNLEEGTIEAVPCRSTEFSANVVKFLNNDPQGLKIKFNGATPTPNYVDIDLDITIKHPLSQHEYDGYDVRGVFIGNGAEELAYNPDLLYAAQGFGQILLNADGYTRWYNPTEFLVPNMFGYIPGKLASTDYTGTATLNPYKYFGDGLGTNENLWDYLNSGDPQTGYFLAGTSNTRNYKIRFPIPHPGIKYGYAVVANWSGTAPEFHPSHAPEAVNIEVEDNSTVYYADPSTKGGNLILDLKVFDWDAELDGGVMEDYGIKVESTVLSAVYSLSPAEMTPTASGNHWYTYHVEIPADNVNDSVGNEMWVIVEDSTADYTNPLGVPNTADTDKITSCFRYVLAVSSEEPMWIQVTIPNGGEQWKVGGPGEITWEANPGIQNVSIALSLNSGADYTQMISPSTPNDGSFSWNPVPPGAAGSACRIRISDLDNPGTSDESDEDFGISLPGIEVIQPNGGEQWKVGGSEEITWEADADIPSVVILLSLNSGADYTQVISLPTPNDGSFVWDPIPAYALGTQDRVRIMDSGNFNIFDTSDADFAVTSPSMDLTAPDGGEQWKAGTPHDITWDADPDIVNVEIELSLNSGTDFTQVIAPSTPNTGLYPWDPVPFGIDSDTCRVKISDADCPDVFAISDGDFEVFQPWISLTSPNGDEELEGYMSWEITWECSETGGTVNLEYSKDDFAADLHTIVINTSNDGSYVWDNIPFDLSDTVSMRIVCPSPPLSDISDSYFSIVEPPPFVRILTPNGGEEWGCGSWEEITWWSYEVTGNVDLYYSKDNFVSDNNLIAEDVPVGDSFEWFVPADLSDTVRVEAVPVDFPSGFDVSDSDFSIIDGGWARTWGDARYESLNGAVSDANGNSYVIGEIYDSSSGYSGALLQKYDAAGQLVWSLTWAGGIDGGDCRGKAIALDDLGYLYVTGWFSGEVDFDPTIGFDGHASNNGSHDIFISKFDSDGTWYWTKTWGGSSDDQGKAIAVRQSSVYVAGEFGGEDVDFDPDPMSSSLYSSNGGVDAFLSWFDTSGNFEEARTWGGIEDDRVFYIAVDDTGIVFATGSFRGSDVNFDQGYGTILKSSNGSDDAFLCWFENWGDNLLGVETWGGADWDVGYAVAVDDTGNVYITGFFNGADVDFDPGDGIDLRSSTDESTDAFVSKFDSSVSYQWVRVWGGSGTDYSYNVGTDGLGNVFAVGTFYSGDMDFDPGPGSDLHGSNGWDDAYLTMFDSSGNYVMARTWGGTDYDEAYGLSVSESGAIFVTGFWYSPSLEFAPIGEPCFEDSDIHSSNGGDDAFLVKYMLDGCW